MLGEAYPVVSELGAQLLERLAQEGPASATTLFDEGVAFTKGAAGSALQRFCVAGLVDLHDMVPATPRRHGHRMRAGPPQLLYAISAKGRAALAAHYAAVAAYKVALAKATANTADTPVEEASL